MSALRFAGLSMISLTYLLFAIIMLGLVLRKHLCTHCYYHNKLCGMDRDKLSSCLFKEKSGNYELEIKLAGLTWRSLTIIPIIAILLAMFPHVDMVE